ncbi:methyltransferase [Streptomyces olivaceiscleroticus]|uniref:Methyltransferase n=1 Tax=Streptomyces olivaceiscleroticus TaxID=68245 RepID=A0ABN0ZD26_9ACTN
MTTSSAGRSTERPTTPPTAPLAGRPANPADGRVPEDPVAFLIEHALGHLFSAALRTAVQYRIADHLAEGPRTVEQLADATGTHAPHLRRLLRYLATRDIFREDATGVFHLTPGARPLRSDEPHSLRDAVLMMTDETFRRSSAALAETVRTAGPSFDRIFGAPLFEFLAADPGTRELFDTGMASLSGPVDGLVAESYPFPEGSTVVDVGGGRGGLLRAVLELHPSVTGVLHDQEPAIARHVLDVPELAGRWRAETGDFFASVPEGGDVYVLKHVLHDWPDSACVDILRRVRDVVPAQGRLLIVDAVLPPGNAPHYGKAMDVAMMAVVDGRERTAEEYATLLSAADFRLTRVLSTPAFPSIVESVPAARTTPRTAGGTDDTAGARLP